MSKYSIDEQTMTDIADGVRWRTGLNKKLTPEEMSEELHKNYGVNRDQSVDVLPDEGPWIRPADWPDLDSLNLEMAGDDFIYMTYDANREASAIVWHIETADGKPATLDIGHIENGVYIVDESYTVNTKSNFVKWTDDYSGYLVLRVTGQISVCQTFDTSRDGQVQQFRMQPILERIAWVPHLRYFSSSYAYYAWGLPTLEREKIANGDGKSLRNTYYAWRDCYRLQSLDISGLYTPNITDMNSTFSDSHALKSLDLRHWNVSNVTSFSGVFANCYGLKELDLTGWDTSSVKTFSDMFDGCRSLPEIRGLTNFNTSKATTLYEMFRDCYNLRDAPVEAWDVSNCTNFAGVFNGCYALQSLDLSGWDVSKATNIGSIFRDCRSLKYLNLSGWHTAELTSAGYLFYCCHNLENIDVSWIHVTDKCTSVCSMFSACYSLKELDIPDDWDLSGLGSGANTANSMFSNCYSLERITGIKDWQFNLTNSLASMFANCYSLKELDVSGWKTDTITNLANMFSCCYSLEHVDLSNWETDNCNNLSGMFNGCWSLKSIGSISHWDTSKVTTFSTMFQDCQPLPEIPDISNWDFGAATTLASMFQGCRSFKEIKMTNIDLPNCTTVATMFRYCSGLRKAILTGWSIPKITATAPGAFLGDCTALSDLEIDIPFALNHSYTNDWSLSHESLINILNSLPTVSTKRTLNLVSNNILRLTEEEKQIATDKNWILAN